MGPEPRLACAVALATLLTAPAAASSSGSLYVNPQRAEAGGDFAGEAGARDYDPLGTSTWATRALGRTCTAQGGCAGVSSASQVWSGFPAGYRPRSLAVYWKAAAGGAMFGGMSQVRATVEYGQRDGKWIPVGSFVSKAAFDTMPPTLSQVHLPPDTDVVSLRIRARLEVEMISCPHVECPANLPNPSNVTGQIWVSDLRLELEPPRLTVLRTGPGRGREVAVRVEGAPFAQIGDWKFVSRDGIVTPRARDLASPIWTFAALDSGTVHALVRLRGQPQLNGRTFALTTPLDVPDTR